MMEGQQEQQQYAPYFTRDENKADLLSKIDPTNIVEIVRRQLLGEQLINGKWLKNSAVKSRALSEQGAWEIATIMLPVSSQNVSISNLTDLEIKRRAVAISKIAVYMCIKNWKDYGITGVDQIYFVNEIVFSNSLITLKHPFEAGVRNFIKGTTTELRSVVNTEPKKNSWLDNAFRARAKS